MTKQLNIAEIRLDMNQPRMLTVQLADELRRLIARDFLDGAVLPSARQLANSLKINRLTVGRAYAELEKQGVITRKSPKVFEISKDFSRNNMEPYPNIGIILPFRFSNLIGSFGGFPLHYIKGIIDAATEQKISVIMLELPGFSASAKEISQFNATLMKRLIGVVHLGGRNRFPDHPLEAVMKNEHLPQVILAAYPEMPNVGAVLFDTRSGIRALAEQLLAMNHKKIGMALYFPGFEYCGNSGYFSYAGHHRPREIRDILREYGMECSDQHCCFSCSTYYATLSALKKMKAAGKLTTVFCCQNDELAFRCIRALRELGLSVPNDISVVGFDGITTDEELTTISQPFYAAGCRAVQQLLDYQKHGISESNRLTYLQTSLILRKTLSCAQNRIVIP
ncbi:MAG: substrate-binding domain-containing protein [Lentisphaeria bacterium]|nr:substrate-binding domain-containing protein [Lentisphaeria bacterium]